MENAIQLENSDLSMKDLLAKAEFDLPKVGQVLTGEIISIGKNAVLIDLGSLGTGAVYPGEFYDNPNLQKALKAGQKVSAILLEIENDDGYRELSLKRAQMTTAWQDIRNKKESGEVIETKVVNINKGGLLVEINGIQGFLPLSQLLPENYPKIDGGDTTKIVQALQKFRNQDIKVKILDFSESENKLIVSEKAINDEQIKEEISKFTIGDVVEAEITDVTDFGAFALINPPATDEKGVSEGQTSTRIEGLIHISEIDWKLIESPHDVLKSGQIVKAKIIDIDGSKISLSLKALKEDPWQKIEEKYSVGQEVEGEVAKMTNYGMLVKLDEEITGLIPVSELGDKKPGEDFKLEDKIKVAIVSIDSKEHKMILTLQKEKTE
ncbi:MAG: S1 RNA-binding domain-containing protein [Candidatus Paceibacterota bacterium]